jgi:pimeloyl-ACP methyl ester carboxylesterase
MKNNKHIYTSLKVIAAISMLALGRFPISRLLSKKQGKRLHKLRSANNCWVKCPSGNTCYVEEDGIPGGQPIVFVHGLNASMDQWIYQRKYFRNTHRLIFIDLPGHGRSPASLNLSMQVLADDMHSILGYLDVVKPLIYGHSMGAAILMQYAGRHASSINASGLILHGGSYTNALNCCKFAAVAKPLEKPLIIPLLKFIKKVPKVFNVLSHVNYYSGALSLMARYAFFTGTQTASQLLYTASLAPQCKAGAVAEGLLQMLKFDVTHRLKHIKVPVWIIGSINDRLNTLKCSQFIHRKIEGSTLIILREGHQSLIENHSKVNKLIEGFAKSLT